LSGITLSTTGSERVWPILSASYEDVLSGVRVMVRLSVLRFVGIDLSGVTVGCGVGRETVPGARWRQQTAGGPKEAIAETKGGLEALSEVSLAEELAQSR